MTISKLTGNIQPLDEVDKINEIIDGALENAGTGTNALAIMGTATGNRGVGIGQAAEGSGAYASGLGTGAKATGNYAIQIGYGTNSTASSLNIGFNASSSANRKNWQLLDGTTGLIPDARLSSNIARTTDIVNRNIGEIVTSTIPLTDAGLHLLDGSLIQGSGIYSDFVDYIASIYDATANYFCTEDEWQASVSTYGACDKYVYDSVNNTVRLPKRTTEHGALLKSYSSGAAWYRIYEDGWCEQGGLNTKDNTTVTLLKPYKDTNYSILFALDYGSGTVAWNEVSSSLTNNNRTTTSFRTGTRVGNWQACGYVDVSDYQYSPIYEYIVIATTTKTDIEVDIDEITTDLNGKADVDLSNVPNSKGILTESYVNGSSWYRVYSDGWCEQGGFVTGSQDYTITFLKPFVNANYTPSLTLNFANNASTCTFGAVNLTSSSMQISTFENVQGNSRPCFWQACGYIN